ncbi:MAG: calcium/sodium antiporter [Candidatus Neomarinimicrobiota bacterium]
MILSIVLLLVGMLLIYLGAESLVWGGSQMAIRLHIAPIVIGLSVVAFGTSLPEFTVSLYSVLNGVNDIGLGNIIGSNIANIALILAASAVIFPVAVNYSKIRLDIVLVIFITMLFMGLGLDGRLSRFDGAILLTGLCLYLYRLAISPTITGEISTTAHPGGPLKFIGAILLGLVALAIGTHSFTRSAVFIARHFHIAELVIGATIVALGTSLPEMATSLVAAFRKQSEIVLGNILGSNVFNLMAVMGIIPLIQPVTVPVNARLIQMPLMLLLIVILWPLIRYQHGLKRHTGIVLLGIYLAFTIYMYTMNNQMIN